MNKALVLLGGVAAWCGVAALSVFMVENFADDNQVLAYVPILLAVILAWAIGEVVTDRVFAPGEEGGRE